MNNKQLPRPLGAEIADTILNWQFELASGNQVEGDIVKLSNGDSIKLEQVAELSQWQRVAGKQVNVVSFNMLAHIGNMQNGEFVPHWACVLESFRTRFGIVPIGSE